MIVGCFFGVPIWLGVVTGFIRGAEWSGYSSAMWMGGSWLNLVREGYSWLCRAKLVRRHKC
jgi:hypothetical protein